MTKQEFVRQYCEASDITQEFFDKHLVVLPCSCGMEGCFGWAAVGNDPEMIANHKGLYSPKGHDNAEQGKESDTEKEG